MHVILWILKGIGIVLGFILVLLLLFLLLALFVSVRYRFQAEYNRTFSGSAFFRWLYPFLEIRLTVQEKKPKIDLRILGLSFKKLRRTINRPDREKKPKVTKSTRLMKPKRKATKVSQENQETPIQEKTAEAVNVEEHDNKPIPESDDGKRHKKHRFSLVSWIKEKWLQIQKRLLELRDKLLALWEKWEAIWELIGQERTKQASVKFFQECKHLLRHLKPKKFQLWLHYGTGDPYTLGQHLQVLAILYGLYGEGIQVKPNWEEKVLELKGDVQGRIRLFTLLHIGIKVIRDKNIKALWKQIQSIR